MIDRELILIRGLPGSGKSTLAKIISLANEVAADDWFDEYNDGVFDPTRLKDAHEWCHDYVEGLMEVGANPIVVHNTFTREREMEAYFKLAKEFGYRVHTLIVENRHGNESIHNVPEKKIEQMRNRFEVIL